MKLSVNCLEYFTEQIVFLLQLNFQKEFRTMSPKMFSRLVSLMAVLFLLAGSSAALAAADHPIPAAQEAPFLDVAWYRENLIKSADLWNGGLDGESGMGAYREDFTGFFHVAMDRQWNQTPMWASTSVAQSRAIYMNVEAYRAAGPEECERFLKALNQGVDFLLTYFRDAEYGGYYWEVSPEGDVVTDIKQGYGNVHPMFALAQAYSITQNPDHLNAAMEQLNVLKEFFMDPTYPGGFLPGFKRDFSEISGTNNVDSFTHFFVALLALYDVVPNAQQAEIADLIMLHGNFLTQRLYHDQDGFTDRGYVAYNYDTEWLPAQDPYTRETQWSTARHATTGHNIELAYLVSRAVERGLGDPAWLDTADKLIKFCTEYAIDPQYGGMLYDIVDYDGKPLEGNPDNPLFIYWAQAETARAFLHFTVVRDKDYAPEFKSVENLFNQYMTDQDYGGLYHALDSTNNLEPINPNKGDVWKTNYHYSMFFAEVLRLAATYPDRVAALGS
jgi:mannobiose 2-epimerase